MYTDKDVRDFMKNQVELALSSLGITKVYADSESIRYMKKFTQNIAILHREETELVETKGTGMCLYESPYIVCWICPKDIENRNINETGNAAKLSDFVETLRIQISKSQSEADCPFSNPPVIERYGIGNEEDPIDLPGSNVDKWVNTLLIYTQFNIYHTSVITC